MNVNIPVKRSGVSSRPQTADGPAMIGVERTTTMYSDDGAPNKRLVRRDTAKESRILFGQNAVIYMLSFVPLGMLAGMVGLPPMVMFWTNLMALIPLTSLVMIAVLKLSSDWSHLSGGLLRAVLGNTVEMTICIVAMLHGEIKLVQSTIIGSVVAYSLLTLGGSLLVASFDKTSVSFSKTQTSVLTSLVLVVSVSLIIPTVMALDIEAGTHDRLRHALLLSRGTAVVLLGLFITFMVFRFYTHERIFHHGSHPGLKHRPTELTIANKSFNANTGLVALLYFAATVGIIICSRYMITASSATSKQMDVTKSFLGLVILPAAGHASKSTVIVVTSRIRKLDSAIRAIMINVLDTLLFVTPVVVLFGWIFDLPMELEFDLFDAILFLLSMVVLTNLLQHAKASYFEGIMLIGTYIVIAASLYVYPEPRELVEAAKINMLNVTQNHVSG